MNSYIYTFWVQKWKTLGNCQPFCVVVFIVRHYAIQKLSMNYIVQMNW